MQQGRLEELRYIINTSFLSPGNSGSDCSIEVLEKRTALTDAPMCGRIE